MSQLLARLARTLSLALEAQPRGGGRRPGAARPGRRRRRRGRRRLLHARARSPSRRSTSSRRTAPPFGGRRLDARLHASTRARSPTPGPGRRSRARSAKVRELDGVEQVGDPFARGRRGLARTAAWRRSTCATRPSRRSIEKADGEALIDGRRDGRARRCRGRGARHPDRPRLRAGRAGRRADRRRRSRSSC